MADSNHIGIKDLLLFCRGEIRDDTKVRDITFHLADCSECFNKMEHLEYMMKSEENFNRIWEECFPAEIPGAEVVTKITGWIESAISKADEGIRKKLEELRNWIIENSGGTDCQLIPLLGTTRGSEKFSEGEIVASGLKGVAMAGDLTIHYDKEVDFSMFEQKVIIDGNLYLGGKAVPDFNTAILIQADGSFAVSDLHQADREFYFFFKGIYSNECIISFERS